MGRRGYLVSEPAENIFKWISDQELIVIRVFSQTGLRGGEGSAAKKGLEALLTNAMQKGNMFTVREKPYTRGETITFSIFDHELRR